MMPCRLLTRSSLFAIGLVMLVRLHALADPTPQPSPSPTPPVRTGWTARLDGMSSFVDQATRGPGTLPPEGAAFGAGDPLSPLTPYDTFSSAPTTPGIAGVGELLFTETYFSRRLRARLTSGFEFVDGSVTNLSYWTESLLPLLNPHVGSQVLPYAIVFPTHAGSDDAAAAGLSVPLSASIGALDGSWRVKAGWFDLTQSDRFVFVQPALTSVTPALTLQPAESLGDGPPALEGWAPAPPGLSLNGFDATLHRGSTTVELTNAALPALPGTSARISLGSAVVDRGEGTRFSGELLHLVTGGAVLGTTTLFGLDPELSPGPQGPLPTSELGGQIQTIAGLRGSFAVAHALHATVEVGRAWYTAQHVLEPGTEKPGGFYHASLTGGASVKLTGEAFRFEPRYATAILPYGAPENIWSVAWSWPGVWLKSNYQLVDNSVAGANRQGYKLHSTVTRGPLELRASFAAFQQIDPASIANEHQAGFVEGFFLPQQPAFATLGRQKQNGAWLIWHRPFGDLSFDYVDDMLHRNAAPSQIQDAVTLDAPQAVLAYTKTLNRRAIVAAGVGRFAMRGTWAAAGETNVDFRQMVTFAGAQFAESSKAMLLVHVRSHTLSGLPSIFEGPSPDFSGSLLVVEQRFHV